ncbi:MAG: hypothetical protein NTX27_05955 [Verrucomicrobia bacterium]|nr:hypothetical protein [Verrucomicrobiota bacterium]
MEVSIARSDDYVRAFHKLSYKVLRPVAWKRLTFLQLGADHYNEVPAGRVAIGDSDGVVEEWQSARAQGAYDRRGMPLRGNQPWVSIHGLDRGSLGKGIAAASRGVVIRSWRGVLGGKPVRLPHLSTYCNEWGRGNFKTAIELGPPPDVKTLKPGDWLEAEVEIVTFPTDPEAYYGPNRLFQEALKKDADTWRLVWREAAANRFQPKARRGTITRNLPLVVRVDASGSARVDVREGVGWLPVTFTGLGQHRGVNRPVYDETVFGGSDARRGHLRGLCPPPGGFGYLPASRDVQRRGRVWHGGCRALGGPPVGGHLRTAQASGFLGQTL